jgi:ssDNA-binding replication factor A large subunit
VKYEVNPEKFLYALRSAEEHTRSRCGKLSIQCRGKTKNKFIFLIMRESEVVAQFPIVEEFLLNTSNQLTNFMETDKIRKYLSKKNRTATVNSIKDLRTGMNHVNLKAKILEVTEPTHVVTRYGNHASVAKALIADKTGTINLCLWNGQIASVSAGDTVQIENAQVSTFRGERHMSLGKKGTLSNVENFKHQVKTIDLPIPKS